jgi:AbrB family looped-hinge helix DNA binding protein
MLIERTLGATKLSTKGQVTIPVDARRRFKLEVGDLILFIEEDGKLILRKG